MTVVRVKENEPFEVAMRRFKRTVEKTGLLTELRSREFYEKPTAERKRKRAAAIKRHYQRLRSQQLSPRLYSYQKLLSKCCLPEQILLPSLVGTSSYASAGQIWWACVLC